MRGARLVISMHIRRQRNIADGGHADDIRQSEAAVHEEHPPVDLRPDAIGDYPARFILVESVKDRATKERCGLRHAVAHNLVDAPRDWVGGTLIVSRLVAKERDQVT